MDLVYDPSIPFGVKSKVSLEIESRVILDIQVRETSIIGVKPTLCNFKWVDVTLGWWKIKDWLWKAWDK